MRKKVLLAVICCIGIICLAGCGTGSGSSGSGEETQASEEETTAETTTEAAAEMKPEQMNDMMIGKWVPAEGFENDIVSFGYMSESGICADSSGQLCIQVDYVLFDGGGLAPAEYEMKDGNLVYTTFVNDMAAGGAIDEEWVIDTGKLSDDKAVINGIAYEKVTDNPGYDDQRATEIINSRVTSAIAGEWADSGSGLSLTINKDGTVHYEDPEKTADGTWEFDGSMMIALSFTDPSSQEGYDDSYWYNVKEDCLEGRGLSESRLIRK